MNTRLTSAIAILLVTVVAACTSTAVPGERFYINSPGFGTAYIPRSVAAVHAAALAALQQDLGYKLESEQLQGDHGVVSAVTATGVWVNVESWAAAEGETRMTLSMGQDTPEMVVRQVMSKIEARLQ